jgi:hypothetical protein
MTRYRVWDDDCEDASTPIDERGSIIEAPSVRKAAETYAERDANDGVTIWGLIVSEDAGSGPHWSVSVTLEMEPVLHVGPPERVAVYVKSAEGDDHG